MNLFSFINKNDNDIFSNFNEKDLRELLKLLKLYKIGYRDLLNLDQKSTFGVEIEFENRNPSRVQEMINLYNIVNESNWKFKPERSIINGYEVSSPILTDTKDSWIELKNICSIIKNNGGKITDRASSHVHMGDQILDDNITNWLNFLKLYSAYENILYRFSYGEYECERASLYEFASPIGKEIEKYLEGLDYNKKANIWELIVFFSSRYKSGGISVRKPLMDTIEFRSANGTLNPIIWQNNINFYEHFLRYSTNPNFDVDRINYRMKNQEFSLEYYNKINIEEALELADLIFDNNLDKVNFLRQYLKNFKTIDEFKKTKVFTK